MLNNVYLAPLRLLCHQKVYGELLFHARKVRDDDNFFKVLSNSVKRHSMILANSFFVLRTKTLINNKCL